MAEQRIKVWFAQKWEPGIIGMYIEPGDECWKQVSGYYASESSAQAWIDGQDKKDSYRVYSKEIVIHP